MLWLALFTLVPLSELILILNVHRWLSDTLDPSIAIIVTVGSVLLTGVLGATLAKQQGLGILAKIQSDLNAHQMPAESLIEGALLLVGGALLLTPGYLTDLFGFSLIFPFTRVRYARRLRGWFTEKIRTGKIRVMSSRPAQKDPPDFIDI